MINTPQRQQVKLFSLLLCDIKRYVSLCLCFVPGSAYSRGRIQSWWRTELIWGLNFSTHLFMEKELHVSGSGFLLNLWGCPFFSLPISSSSLLAQPDAFPWHLLSTASLYYSPRAALLLQEYSANGRSLLNRHQLQLDEIKLSLFDTGGGKWRENQSN